MASVCTTDDHTELASLPPRHRGDRRKAKNAEEGKFLHLTKKNTPTHHLWTSHSRIHAGDFSVGMCKANSHALIILFFVEIDSDHVP